MLRSKTLEKGKDVQDAIERRRAETKKRIAASNVRMDFLTNHAKIAIRRADIKWGPVQ